MADTSLTCIFVSIGAGIGGYFLRTFLANATSKRKEDWERLRTITQDVNNIADKATQFYCSPPSDPKERRDLGIKIQGLLRANLQDTTQLAQLLEDASVTGYPKRLRVAITLDFDSANIEPLSTTDPIVQNLEYEANAFIGALHRIFCKKYRKK